MKKIWSDEGWEDYLYWQSQDKKTLKKINSLIKSIERNGVIELRIIAANAVVVETGSSDFKCVALSRRGSQEIKRRPPPQRPSK